MSRKRLVNSDQEPLFSGGLEVSGEMLTWEEREENLQLNAQKVAREAGVPRVDLLDRARRITLALDEMSEMSRIRLGFLTSTHTKSRRRIDQNYGANITPIVERKAKNKLPEREKRVKKLLGPATGYSALRSVVSNDELSTMPLDEINARAKYTWNMFTDTFSGPPNLERRTQYRTMMARHIKLQQQLRSQLGAPTETASDEKAA